MHARFKPLRAITVMVSWDKTREENLLSELAPGLSKLLGIRESRHSSEICIAAIFFFEVNLLWLIYCLPLLCFSDERARRARNEANSCRR